MGGRAECRHAERRAGGRGRRLGGDGGAALIEFALILPILAVLAFGTIDLGRSYELKNAVTNMAREGAFVTMTNACDPSKVVDAAKNENAQLSGKVTVSVVQGSSATGTPFSCETAPPSGSQITTVVTTQMKVITPLVAAIVGNEVTITGTATVVVP